MTQATLRVSLDSVQPLRLGDTVVFKENEEGKILHRDLGGGPVSHGPYPGVKLEAGMKGKIVTLEEADNTPTVGILLDDKVEALEYWENEVQFYDCDADPSGDACGCLDDVVKYLTPFIEVFRVEGEIGMSALGSMLHAVMTLDAGGLESAIQHAHQELGIEEDAKDTDDVLKLFGWDRNATKGGTDED